MTMTLERLYFVILTVCGVRPLCGGIVTIGRVRARTDNLLVEAQESNRRKDARESCENCVELISECKVTRLRTLT
jgi:hypothetical protein